MSFLVLLAVAGVLGAWAFRPFGIPRTVETLALALLTGFCLCAVVILALGSFSLRLAQFVLLLLAAAGLAYEVFVAARRRGPAGREHVSATPLSGLEYACLAATAGALLLALLSALAPVTSWDAGVAHLALASDYAREGRITLLEGNAYSAYPQLMHSLYAYALYHGAETSATLINWTFALLCCLVMFGLGRRVGGRRCGLIAPAILATAPIFIDQAGTVSLDLAFSALVLGALACLMMWRDEGAWFWLVLAGFLAGGSCGVRHTGYLVCVLLGVAPVLLKSPSRVRAGLCFWAVALMAAGPWLLRSLVVTGNPVYPFFLSELSPNGVADADITALASHESLQYTKWYHFLMFPWNVIMRPSRFDGWSKSPGGLVLLLGLPGLIVGGTRARALGAFSVVGGACMFFFRHYARYFLPFFLPMMVVAGDGACRLRPLRRSITGLLVFTFVYGLAFDLAVVHFKLPVVFGVESREAYLMRRVERYGAFQWVNENLSDAHLVLTLDPRSYYLKVPTYQNFEALKRIQRKPIERQLAWLKARGIRYFLYPEAYLEESPGFRESGLLQLMNKWRRDTKHFVCIRRLELPRPRVEDVEVVEIYEIHYDR